ncbi:MAG: tetratricopeptide repeat protein [Trueperaceae bacterium]|nr:MAG: tetratricopeptide repeat protein [Trueperaceae bacterium]
MTIEDREAKKEQLKRAIAAQEGLRGTLGHAIVDATIAALQQQLDELESKSAAQKRKLMTVLFMDVVASTRLVSELDPEENLAIMDAVLQRLALPVATRGGRVVRFMGDGFKAAFGLTRARENDPEMAVRAGLGILDAARKIAADLESEHQLEGFQVRVGVNTGLVVTGGVTEGEGALTGLTVNLAARLESAAPPGGLLISQDTYQHVRGLFEVEPGRAIAAKGFAEPVQVYRVKKAKPRAFDSTTRGIEGVETTMIGREAELRSLQEAIGAVRRERGGRFVTIVGEAGIGKSRLLGEFERWLDLGLGPTPIELFKGRATPETLELPYGLLSNLIADRVGILENDAPSEVRTKLVAGFTEALGEDVNGERNAHFVGQLLGFDFHDSPYLQGVLDDPRQLRDRTLNYLNGYLAALAAERTLVIFLEDVHWADESSLDLLLPLIGELSSRPALVIALTRPSLFERVSSWETVTHDQRLELQPLTRRESQQLVGEVLKKVVELPHSLRDLIIQNAEGNPFYLEELIKMLIEDGVIEKSEPQWRLHPERLGVVRIPPTLTGVIQARLEGLPEPERSVLQQASVVGRVFWDEAVCYLNQGKPPDRMREPTSAQETKRCLDALTAREMIFEQVTSAFSDAAEYFFEHTILREVTYESVLKRMRRSYHAMVADWLIEHSSNRAGQISGLIAGHLEKAGRAAEALEYLKQAAEAAVANYAVNEAVDFYSRALALVPDEDLAQRYQLLKGRMNVYATQGNRVAQREDLASMTGVADRLEDERKRAEVVFEYAWLAFWIGDFAEMEAAAGRAIDLAETAQQQDLVGKAYLALAWAQIQLSEHEAALSHAQTALELAQQTGDPRAQKSSFDALAMIHMALGAYTTARDHNERALALAQKSGDPKLVAVSLNNLGVVSTLLGDFQDAWDKYQQHLEISREIGDSVYEAMTHVNLGWVSSAQGNWDLAREHALTGVELTKKVDHHEAAAEGLVWLGHAWLGLKQPEKAAAAYRESLDIRRRLEQTHLATGALAGLARVAATKGDLTLARKHIDEIVSYLAKGGTLNGTWEPLRIYLTCFDVLEQVDDPRADQILEEAFGFLQQRADQIPNEADRRRYLEDIPWHRDIVAAWSSRRAPA